MTRSVGKLLTLIEHVLLDTTYPTPSNVIDNDNCILGFEIKKPVLNDFALLFASSYTIQPSKTHIKQSKLKLKTTYLICEITLNSHFYPCRQDRPRDHHCHSFCTPLRGRDPLMDLLRRQGHQQQPRRTRWPVHLRHTWEHT